MRDYLELTKPRITGMILICTAVGFIFGCDGRIRLAVMVHTLLGTALIASGAAALNQWSEFAVDARMRRTRGRPIPGGRIGRPRALLFGISLSIVGFFESWLVANLLAALLGLFTLVTYLLVYTPMKRRTPHCTVLGAVPDAMPPLIGFAAGNHALNVTALALFLILFVWQFPHFDSIAWMYREDYARGGIFMLPVVEPDGRSTARRIVAASWLLLPVSLLPRVLGMAGVAYTLTAVAGTAALLFASLIFERNKTTANARHILLISVLYLPAVLITLMADRTG